MKAIALEEYGGPEVLRLTDLPNPPVGPDTVLVQTRAAGVNPVDWKVRQGYLDHAFPSHFPLIPGWDVAGVVAAVGPAITEFSPGDEVFGYVRRDDIQFGTYAELVPAPIRTLAAKPARLSWAEAGGVPLAGLTALQALRAVGVGEGDTVLVHAAAGGVGTFAVQLARILGARVIGTARESNHDYLRGLGAEPVTYGDGLMDRVRTLVTDGVDAALDAVGGEALDASAVLVKDPARIVSVVDAARAKELGGRYVFVRPDAAGLATLAGYADSGRLTVPVYRTFPLAEAAEAQRLVAGGHVRGKVVIEV